MKLKSRKQRKRKIEYIGGVDFKIKTIFLHQTTSMYLSLEVFLYSFKELSST